MGGHRHRVEDTMTMQSVGDASVVGIRHLTMRLFGANARLLCRLCDGCRVAPCCDLPGDSFSFCKVSDLAVAVYHFH